MARIAYSEITLRKYIVLEGEPYEVIASQITKKNRQKPSNQTKLKSLVTGKVTEKAFHQSDVVEEADIDTKKIKYLYSNKGEFWFCEESDPSKRFNLAEEQMGDAAKYMKTNSLVNVLLFEENIIGVKLPIKLELTVTEAPPAVRGNTAQGATKQVTLESGATVNAPLFINEGDVVRVNTGTGEYVERAEKK